MMTDPTSLPYRPCVGIVLLNAGGLAWIGRRYASRADAEGPGKWWQMPQGGIDRGEDPADAARRELWEETNVRSADILAESAGWLAYDLPPDLVGHAWGGRYRGQSQKWILMRFTGDEAEIDVLKPGNGAHKPEFIEWRWAPLGELPSLIVPFKRAVYDQVVAEFAPLARPAG